MKVLRNEEVNEPLISVLMSTYNREDTIRETIASVLSQTYRNFQFVIVDDGSTDCSCKIVESFHDSRIELVRLPQNRHICYALNVALEKARGEYIARIDSDDLWVKDKLYKQLTFMRQHPEYKITFTKCDVIDENSLVVNDREKNVFALLESGNFTGQADALRYFFYDLNCLAHPSVMMHVDVFKEVGFYNPCYVQSQDFDYWVRAAKKYPIYVMQERLVKYRRFSERCTGDENLSQVTDIHGIRYLNEVMNIRAHFFDDMSDELFVQTFRQDFKNPNASTTAELACEKAFLQCVPLPGSNAMPAAGFDEMIKLFLCEETRKTLESVYGYIEKDFYAQSCTHVYNDIYLARDMFVMNEQILKLNEQVSNLNEQLRLQKTYSQGLEEQNYLWKAKYEEIIDSKIWRATAPLRAFKDALRSK